MALQSTTAIATVTLQSASPEVTFSSIPNTYRDLVLVINGAVTFPSDGFITLQLNNDSGGNYNTVYAANASSANRTNVAGADLVYGSSNTFITQTNIMDYAQTNKHKTMLTRAGDASATFVFMSATRYASTTAVNSLKVLTTNTSFGATGSLSAGMTISLYGRIA